MIGSDRKRERRRVRRNASVSDDEGIGGLKMTGV